MKTALKWTGIVLGVLIVAIILFAAFFDWNMLRGPIARQASAATGRTVRIDRDLKVHLLSWTPSATINGLKIGNPDWAGKENMAEVKGITVSVKLLPLLKGDVILPVLEIQQPRIYLVRQESGRANWDFGKKDKKESKPTKLPAIRRFIVDGGKLTILDEQRHLMFVGALNSSERAGRSNETAFRLEGKGALNREPFLLKVSGGPLINIQPDKPYPFDAEIRAGATHLTAKGQIAKPFDLGSFETTASVSGNDLADLYYLTALALPNTPPYSLKGQIRREGATFHVRNMVGKVGDSDLEGDMRVNTASGRPDVKADLRSKMLDLDDLGAIFGGAPKTGKGETASPKQKKIAQKMEASDRLLPDATLQVDRVRSMDATVHYRADAINITKIPLKEVLLDLTLDHGVMTIHPVQVTMPQGKLVADIRLDARKNVPISDMDARLNNIRLETLAGAKTPGGEAPLSGTLQARAKLHMTGNSVHRAASTADGTVTFVIPHGEIRAAFAELISVNAARGLGLLLSKDQQKTELRCAVANFPTQDGVMTAQPLVFDTEPTIVTGTGTINLKTEALDLDIEGKSKHFSVTHLMAPVTIGGHLRKPAIGIKPAKPAAQVAAAVALGVVLTPLASILPFVDPGLADDANCGALLAQAKQNGASTKAVAPAKSAKP